MRKALIATGGILLVLVVTGLQSFAQGSEVCVCIDKKGNMKFSETGQCKPVQSLLCWNVEGIQGPQGEPGEPGPAGSDGLNCWDLNGNHNCDIETEDKNSDGICNALDCKGSIRVYDASGQYLGILLGNLQDPATISHIHGDPHYIQIFMPDVNRSTYIVLAAPRPATNQIAGHIMRPKIFFDDENCQGNPYLAVPEVLVGNWQDENYYYGESPGIQVILKSWNDDGSCNNTFVGETIIFPAIKVDDVPSIFPVALPLYYEYE